MSIQIRALIGILLFLLPVAFSQSPDDPLALVQRAYQLQQGGDYASAAQAYRDFLKLRPNEVGAHSNLGVVLTKLGRYEEAITEYEAADKLLPGDPRIVVNLALAYEKSGRMLEARKTLKILHATFPQDKQTTMLLADAYLQSGENGEVVELLQPLERQTPDDLATAYLLGTALIRQRRIGEGQVLLDRILKNGDTAEARFLLGMQMYESGDYPAAVKQFAAAIEVNPKLPELQEYYGLALLTTGDPDAATDAFNRELESNPNNFAANLGLGQILTVRKQFAKAESLLKNASLMRPQSAEAKLALGECLSAEGNLNEAREQLEAATKTLPNSAEAHLNLARVYARLKLAKESSREQAAANRLSQGGGSAGPKLNDVALDFTLPNIATGTNVSLHDFREKSPVVLMFGSYTCPNFRSAAPALKTLQSKYGDKVPFLLIYIREAHGSGDWQSTRNVREGVDLPQANSLSEKQGLAAMCSRALHLPFPSLLDGLDNRTETQYGAWPSRAFVIDREGRIRYSSHLTELDFSAADMESALRSVIATSRTAHK